MLAYTYISPGKFELIDKPKDFAKKLLPLRPFIKNLQL